VRSCAAAYALMAAAAFAAAAPDIESLLGAIAKYEFGASREQQAHFSDLVRASAADPAGRKRIEMRMLRFLESDATGAGKDFVLRELSLVATGASVPVLARMLEHAETKPMALYALTRIPDRAAGDALRKRLGDAAVIQALGQRRDSKSVRPLSALLASPTPLVAETAAWALSKIATPAALDALGKSNRFPEAYLACAENMGAGDKRRALEAYGKVLAGQPETMLRIRALSGLTAADPASAVPELASAVASGDARLEGAAVGFLAGISGPAATTALVGALPKLAPRAQVRVLTALGERGDRSARSAVTGALASGEAPVRAAALMALGGIGNAADVMPLAEAAANGEGSVQSAARRSLYGLRDTGADSAIVAGIRSSAGKVKTELILAAGERGAAGAADALIEAAGDSGADIRREAVRALKNVAGPAQAPALVELVAKAPTASARRDAVQALSSVLRRSKPAPIAPVLTAYRTASPAARLALTEAMGQSSSAEALPLLRAGVKATDAETARAAILALSEWSDPAPLPDLLAAAESGASPALRTLALRGYLKLTALPSTRTPAETGVMLRGALRLAKQPAEQRTVLSMLPLYPCKESLDAAEALLNDRTLAAEAKTAAERIRASLHPR
jgi:HEAT repeat protein